MFASKRGGRPEDKVCKSLQCTGIAIMCRNVISNVRPPLLMWFRTFSSTNGPSPPFESQPFEAPPYAIEDDASVGIGLFRGLESLRRCRLFLAVGPCCLHKGLLCVMLRSWWQVACKTLNTDRPFKGHIAPPRWQLPLA